MKHSAKKQTVDGRNKTDGDTGKIAGFLKVRWICCYI